MNRTQKLEVLRNAVAVLTKTPHIRAYLVEKDPKALEQSEKALAATLPYVKRTPAEREAARQAKRFEAQKVRIIKSLASIGIKEGGHGISLGDPTIKVRFTSAVTATQTGYVVDAAYPNGTVQKGVNAMAFRPDFEAMDSEAKPKAKVSRKPVEQPKAAAGGRKG